MNWVSLALASATDPNFLWVDVRTTGEVLSDSDPLSRNAISPNRLAVVRPSALAPDHTKANIAVSAVVRTDEPPENLQVLLDFLRLPERTQATLAGIVSGGQPRVVVLSNAHRLMGYYTVDMAGPLLRAIVATGVVVILTFADAPNDGRFAFDVVLHLEGKDPKDWKQAKLRVEKGPSSGILHQGADYRLGDLEVVAKVLSTTLG